MKTILLLLCSSLGHFASDFNNDGIVNFKDFAIVTQSRCDSQFLSIIADEWLKENDMNKALLFDGITGFVDTGETFQSTFRDSFTITGWCKASDGVKAQQQHICGAIKLPVPQSVFLAVETNGKFSSYYESTTSAYTIEDAPTFVNGINTWNMVAAVFTKLSLTTMRIDLYVNGTLRKQGAVENVTMGDYTTDRNFFLGASNDNSGAASFFEGSLDDVRIHGKALSANEVAAIYNGGIGRKAHDSDFAAVDGYYMNMDDGSGNPSGRKIIGGVGSDLNGTITGGVTWQDGGIPFEPSGVNYYIIKRGTTVIGYSLDPVVNPVLIDEDISALADGTYSYTVTSVSKYDVEGEASDALVLTVASGQIATVPAYDVNSIIATAAAGGKITLSWKYTYDPKAFMPDKFNIYYYNGSAWIKDGELAYYASTGRYSYTTDHTWTNGATAQIKIKPQKGTAERETSVVTAATADTTGPVVTTAVVDVEVN